MGWSDIQQKYVVFDLEDTLWVAYKIETLLYYFYESGVNPYGLRNREPNEYKKEMEDKFVYYLNLLCNLKKN
ncbi:MULTISPECIES: hypothetical protein [Bacillota]|uniref:hypothetical protein n=1 Tax=Bacillota TaxID=1239 RepID=UPI002FCAE885